MGTPAIGARGQLAIGQTLALTKRLDFLSESITRQQTHIDGSGIRGTRSHPKERMRHGTYTVGGTITLNPSHLDLDTLLPLILGAAESTDVFALAETVPEFYVQIDRVTKVFSYDGCKVSRATFSGSEGGLLTLSLDIVGKRQGSITTTTFTASEADGTPGLGAAGNFPSISLGVSANDQPFCFAECTLEIQGSTRSTLTSFEVSIDNGLQTRFSASRSATAIMETDRIVTVRATFPYTTDEVALYDQALAGVNTILRLVNAAGNVLSFDFATLQIPATSPTINGKGEIMLEINGVARKSSATNELIVTSQLLD